MNNGKNYFDLQNCSALIAGGATGLGYEMAEGLLSVGCNVTIIGRSAERVKSSASELDAKYNSTCFGIRCDISDENSILDMMNKVCLLYTSQSPRDRQKYLMASSG